MKIITFTGLEKIMESFLRKRLTLKEVFILLFFLFFITSLAFWTGWKVGYQGLTFDVFREESKELNDIKRAYVLVNNHFDGDFDVSQISEQTIEKLIESLNDPYSYYVTKEDYQKFKNEEKGEFTGIGVIYEIEEKTPLIIEVLPGSPAEKAGLKAGEKIIKIDDIGVADFDNEIEIINKLKGNEGEKARLEVLDKSGKKRELIIERRNFKISDLSFNVIDDGVGYLKIYQFNPILKEEFIPFSNQLRNHNIKKLVIDLRNNIGGNMMMAIFLADQFLQKGVIVKEKIKGSNEIVSEASGGASFSEVSLLVLVNKRTASAAEVFTAAIQDNNRGIIAGEKTKGKATEQQFFELKDGSAINLTVGKWFTPKGDWLMGKGIKPDIEITEDFSDAKGNFLEEVAKHFSN